MDIELGNKIAVMQMQLKEIQSCLSGLQSIAMNGNDAIHKEVADLKNQQDIIIQKLDKLSGDVKLVNAEGKLCGDVDYAAVEPVVEAITPVPGGVGSVTTSVLVSHVVEAAAKKAGM